MTKVKICGIQRVSDALVAAEAGADYVGLVFVPGARRRVEKDTASVIVSRLKESLGGAPEIVGLFTNQPIDVVNRTIRDCKLDLVQLCGQESVDYCARMLAPAIKVIHVSGSLSDESTIDSLSQRVRAYSSRRALLTLDRSVDGLTGGHRPGL